MWTVVRTLGRRLFGSGRKVGDSWWVRLVFSFRAEYLHRRYGRDDAGAITRDGLAMVAELPMADKLLPGPRRPEPDPPPAVLQAFVLPEDWRNAPTMELPSIGE